MPRKPAPATPIAVCPFDLTGMAGCPFNEPTAPATAHRSRVGCRWFGVEVVDGSPRGICRHPEAPVSVG